MATPLVLSVPFCVAVLAFAVTLMVASIKFVPWPWPGAVLFASQALIAVFQIHLLWRAWRW